MTEERTVQLEQRAAFVAAEHERITARMTAEGVPDRVARERAAAVVEIVHGVGFELPPAPEAAPAASIPAPQSKRKPKRKLHQPPAQPRPVPVTPPPPPQPNTGWTALERPAE